MSTSVAGSDETIFHFLHIRPPEALTKDSNLAIISPKSQTPLYLEISKSEDTSAKQIILQHFLTSNRVVIEVPGFLSSVKESLGSTTVGEAVDDWERRHPNHQFRTQFGMANYQELVINLWDSYCYRIIEKFSGEVENNEFLSLAEIRATLQLTKLIQIIMDSTSDADQIPIESELSEMKILVPKNLTKGFERTNDRESTQCEVVQERREQFAGKISLSGDLWEAAEEIKRIDPLGHEINLFSSGETTVGDGNLQQTQHFRFRSEPWPISAEGLQLLSERTQRILSDRKSKLATETSYAIQNILRREAQNILRDIITGPSANYLDALAKLDTDLSAVKRVPLILPFGGQKTQDDYPRSSSNKKLIARSIGIGDLLVVRQSLTGYQVGEIAHIENVLDSERRARKHVRGSKIEQYMESEIETKKESEKDLQTAERFELQAEASKVIQSQNTQQAGFSLSATYGAVTFSAHTDSQTSSSTQSANRTATNYSKQITEHSLERVSSRVKKLQSQRIQEYFEETNEHSFDNTSGTKNIIGIYRWLNKRYRARLINYGRRLMLEFIVPEPASFYKFAKSQQKIGVDANAPQPPKIWGRPLQPADLTEDIYLDFVAEYSVRDVTPYPGPMSRGAALATTETGGAPTANQAISKASTDLDLGEGYMATDYRFYASLIGWPQALWTLTIAGQLMKQASVYGLTGKIPISLTAWSGPIALTVEVYCIPTLEKISSWQLETFTKIMTAYQVSVDEFKAKQPEARNIEYGENPNQNRITEQEELKRASIRLLTNDFDRVKVGDTWLFREVFDAMRTSVGGQFNDFDINEAIIEGKVIQFFEQAFEWENLSYRFYPYYWGRSSTWVERYKNENSDPKFIEFLTAGSARVVVPAHPEYNDAVLHYLETKEIWLGGDSPTVDDPLYVSIAAELRSRDDLTANGEDLPYAGQGVRPPCIVDEWDVDVPTELVYLQSDPTLPWKTNKYSRADLELFLDQKVVVSGRRLAWRRSVVDLLVLIGVDSTLAARKQLASKLKYPGNGSTSKMNTWLHSRVLELLLETSGKWPSA